MLGHVAQSIGAGLPGAGGLNPFLGSFLVQEDGTTINPPVGARFAFVEVLSQGAAARGGSGTSGAGGTGNDRIFEILGSAPFSFALRHGSTSLASTVSFSSTVILTATGPGESTGSSQAAIAGKYRGTDGAASAPGRGGGRLAGGVPSFFQGQWYVPPGPGAGARTGSSHNFLYGGRPIAAITFFRNREAAVAFANSLYSGAWVPS